MNQMDLTRMAIDEIPQNIVFACTFAVLFIAISLYALKFPQGGKRWWVLAAVSGVLLLTGQFLAEGWLRTAFLDAAALVTVAMVWDRGTPQAVKAARNYLAMMIIGMALIAVGLILSIESNAAASSPPGRLAVAFLLVGFGLKLALVPFYLWLPGVAEHAAPMTAALIISVVDISAFCELAHVRLTTPWVFDNYAGLWLTVALLSMFGGAMLALAQHNVKRMLAFSTVDDMGYLLLGLVTGSAAGLSGALLGALSHSIFKVMLFGAVGVAEAKTGRPLTLDERGMAARLPVSGAAFIIGALGMIGVPPLFGFVGRWRLYLAGAEYGGRVLVLAMILASGLALLYYMRAVHRVWLGPAVQGEPAGEPKLAVFVFTVLAVWVIGLGLFPGCITRIL